MTRRIFYSFHYKPDSWRTSEVRNIGTVSGNKPAHDNDWETIKKGGDAKIKQWIKDQMEGRSCTVILAGKNTADRKWINYEITKSWEQNMGVVVIDVHGLKDKDGETSTEGHNPLKSVAVHGTSMADLAKRYTPVGSESTEKYDWISKNIEQVIEEAIEIRKKYSQ